ncbi:glycosyltransferase family 2 protein [uncultured Rheinheimera sp.]|uniref:glycosyltransferase family 2 protein n=1 Tax=uncultured Rheinheimera sp. TaxID=400532 RepID=UPI002599F15A|nr:glycosyltransferase family 2 protein [uncultured Rheinheimera sp.]
MVAPTITALMTTYNCASTVEDTIKSILAQSYTNFEFLILDDGSTDETCARIKGISDSRIRFYQYKDNIGVGARLSQALELITTPYIAKVDSDDISSPERFSKQLAYLQENQHVSLVKSYIDYFPDNDIVAQSERYTLFKKVKEHEINSVNTAELIHRELRRWSCFPHTTYMGKTSSIKDIGYPNSRIFEDYYLFYTMLNRGYVLGCIPEYLVRMRVSNSSTTATTTESTIDEGLNVIVDFKLDAIKAVVRSKNIFIYGSGQLAQSLARNLLKRDILVSAFLDKEHKAPVSIADNVYPVVNINEAELNKINDSVIVAAQPVRDQICHFLTLEGWEEWKHFMVIA